MSLRGKTRSQRPFLLYCPSFKTRLAGRFFGPERLFDVAIHDYSGDVYAGPSEAEYQFAGRLHKWPAIDRNLRDIPQDYEYYGFFDDDLIVSTLQMNHLFTMGKEHGLDLFQASLSASSIGTYFFHFQKTQSVSAPRRVPLVEVMMPIFSRPALEKCRETFGISESGWGLDLLWRKYEYSLSTIDEVSVTHPFPVASGGWLLSNGLKPIEEKGLILSENGLVELDARFLGGPIVWRVKQWMLKFLCRIKKAFSFISGSAKSDGHVPGV